MYVSTRSTVRPVVDAAEAVVATARAIQVVFGCVILGATIADLAIKAAPAVAPLVTSAAEGVGSMAESAFDTVGSLASSAWGGISSLWTSEPEATVTEMTPADVEAAFSPAPIKMMDFKAPSSRLTTPFLVEDGEEVTDISAHAQSFA